MGSGFEDDDGSSKQMSLLLEYLGGPPPPQKNTFIHYVDEKATPLFRCHTEPPSCAAGGAGRPTLSRAALAALDRLGCDSEGGSDAPTPPAEGFGGPWPRDVEDSSNDTGLQSEAAEAEDSNASSFQSRDAEESCVRRPPHDTWVVEGKKLRGKDTRQTHVFLAHIPEVCVPLGLGGPIEFVVMLRPKVKDKRRGGGSFAASQGMGHIEIKCTVQIDMMLALSVQVGNGGQPSNGLPPLFVLHNFAKDAICKLPTEWNFLEAIDTAQDAMTLGFLVEARPSPQAAYPFCGVVPASGWEYPVGAAETAECEWWFCCSAGDEALTGEWASAAWDPQAAASWAAPVMWVQWDWGTAPFVFVPAAVLPADAVPGGAGADDGERSASVQSSG